MPNLGILGLTLFCMVFIVWMSKKAESTMRDQIYFRRVFFFYGLYLFLVSLMSALTISGFFYNFNTYPPRSFVLFIVILGVLLFLSFQKISKGLKLLMVIPAHWLILLQMYRLGVEWILAYLHIEEIVPVELTLYGRNFDLLVGLSALPVAFLVWKKHKFSYHTAIIFNTISIISLVNIIWIAVMSLPSSFQKYETNLLTSYFPGILIPSFLAPVAIYISILSIKQIQFLQNRERKIVAI
jgi:hypothetical protein